MKKFLFVLAAIVSACGGSDTTGPFTGLSGTYSSLALPDDPAWIVSWPSTSSQTGCAQIQSDRLTFNSASSVTEDRGYVPLEAPFLVTLANYQGTYGLIEGTNQIVLRLDGAVDTAVIGTYQGRPGLVAQRRFPDYTSCGSVGPYTMLFVNSPVPQ
jgi:hypothetical protein